MALLISAPVGTDARGADDSARRWFGDQVMPKGIVRGVNEDRYPEPRAAHQMMVQSVAGLAAKAVNEGRGDEMVWVGSENADMQAWWAAAQRREPKCEVRGTFGPWELVERYKNSGVIKGYVLYRLDRSKGAGNEHRAGMDRSVNVATSVAGLLDGIVVDENLEAEARRRGLAMLLDAREKSQAWCFATYKDRFNRRLICTQDPRKANVRDLAIAQKAFTFYGDEELTSAAMEWLEPLSPVLGWNGGDEFQTTRLSSVYGQFQTATDWCANLPVLMAGNGGALAGGQSKAATRRAKGFDPRGIDWNDRRSGVSFVLSDGDNVQWLESSFFRNAHYWGNKDRGSIPLGWSYCFAEMAQLCPPAVEYGVATQTANDTLIEWGGGYYYPDLFAGKRAERWKLLAAHARRTWEMMRRNNTRIIGFNVAEPDSADARKAYEVFAGETDGLAAILVFKYAPYEGMAGEVYWVKDRRGVEIPVITARYSIWANSNRRARCGTPAKVAREIRETVAGAAKEESPRFDWAIAHAWSYFRRAQGTDENAENLGQEDAWTHGGERGYAPITWCAERLPAGVRVISPEEMAWHVRMQHDPEQTREVIRQIARDVAPQEKLFVATPLTEKGSFTAGVEGPACDGEGNLYVVNYAREQTIGRMTPDGKAEVFVTLPGKSTGNGIVFDRKGAMFVADYVGHNVLRVDMKTREVTVFAHEERMNQPNDLTIAGDGTMYASDPDWKKGVGQVWRIDVKGKVSLAAGDMGTSNGIELSPDGKTLYVNESVQRKIWKFAVAADGSLSEKRLVKEFADFGFDGMRCDVDGNLYVTRHGKGTVVKLSPAGEELREVDVLGDSPTNICFGGLDGRTAYVTEAKERRVVQFRVDRAGLAWERWKR